MSRSNLLKFVVGTGLVMGALAIIADQNVDAPQVPVVVEEAAAPSELPIDVVETMPPERRSTSRSRTPVLSAAQKEAIARKGEQIEARPPKWGEDGIPPTDSLEKTEISRKAVD